MNGGRWLKGFGLSWILALGLLAAALLGPLAHGAPDTAFGLAAAAFLAGFGATAAFVWAMASDCLRRPFETEGRRLGYLLLILLTVPWGAVFYGVTVARRPDPVP